MTSPYDLQLITNKAKWDHFFNAVGAPSFHQSWEWGTFQQSLGYEIVRLGLYADKKLEAIALVIKIRSKRGNFLFIPHGPLCNIPAQGLAVPVDANVQRTVYKQLNVFRDFLVAMAKKEGFWFIRVAPIFSRTDDHLSMFRSLGFRTAPLYIHAETMWVLDITPPEQEILAGMRKNTRNLIRRADREHISVTTHDSLDALESFWQLYEITADREQFIPYPKSYITKEFQAFNEEQNALFFIGGFHNSPKDMIPPQFAQEHASQILAGSLVVFTNSTAFYHQGASIHTPFPVTYRLQWEAILAAKNRGCHYYNFYGIYDPGRTPDAWKGLSLFKRGFGGFQVDYLQTQDYVVSPAYFFSYAVDKYLSFKRGIR